MELIKRGMTIMPLETKPSLYIVTSIIGNTNIAAVRISGA
jgi:hypothetical protein